MLPTKVSLQTKSVVVLDNFLPLDLFDIVAANVLVQYLSPARIISLYSRTWSLNGNLPYSSEALLTSQAPHENYADTLGYYFLEVAKLFPEHVKAWDDCRLHVQLYGRGIRLNWHTDKHSYGSFTFYAHREWGENWGGELLTSDEEKGQGVFLTPVPNRCVLTAPGVRHCVNRVDPAAGDSVRVSVVGFLLPAETAEVEVKNY